MRTARRLATLCSLTGLVTGLALAPTPAAHAMIIKPTLGNCGYESTQVCAGAGQAVPVGLSRLTVTFTCTATSPFVVDRTGVGCYLRGLTDGLSHGDTGSLFLPGNVGVVANVVVVPFQAYEICVGAGYSTPTGGFEPVQGYRCLIV